VEVLDVTYSSLVLAELILTVTVAVLVVGAVTTLVMVTAAAVARRAMRVLVVMVDTLVGITQPTVLAVAVEAVV
jgi:hypothetical protein